jgi:hypothetical protein
LFPFSGPRGWIAVAAALLCVASAEATPRYALRVGQSCNLCHHDPTGGGLRSTYASQYLLPERIARPAPDPETVTLPDPQIGQDVLVGADLRTTHLYRDDTNSGNNFLQMQGALYLSFQPDPRFSAYVHTEFGQGNAQAHAIFAMAYILPASGYVKAGRFVPAFGWKVPDHRAFVRRDFVFLPAFPPHADTGVEVGFHPGAIQLQAAVLNGEPRSPRDGNNDLAYVLRGSWSPATGGLNGTIGGSYYRNAGVTEDVWAGGPFAGASWGRITWHGEVDWTHRETDSAVLTTVTTSHELAVELTQGLDAVGTYDFHDVDVNRQSGAVHRIGGGLQFLPYPFLELTGKLNAFRLDAGPAIAARTGYTADFLQSVVELHFLY